MGDLCEGYIGGEILLSYTTSGQTVSVFRKHIVHRKKEVPQSVYCNIAAVAQLQTDEDFQG